MKQCHTSRHGEERRWILAIIMDHIYAVNPFQYFGNPLCESTSIELSQQQNSHDVNLEKHPKMPKPSIAN